MRNGSPIISTACNPQGADVCYSPVMPDTAGVEARLTDAEVAKIRRRRGAMRASLAAEGLVLTPEEERMLDEFEAERLTPEHRRSRVVAYGQSLRRKRHAAAG